MSKLYIKNIDGTYSPYQPVAVSNLDIVQETGSSLTSSMSQKAVTDELAKKQDNISDLADIKDGAALGKTALQEESDPTVPSWAKAATKPTYTAAEVGALPSDTEYVKKIEVDTTLGNISVYKSDGSSTNTAIIAESALKLNKTCKIEFNGSFNSIIGFDGSEEDYFIDTSHTHPEYAIEDIDTIRSGAAKGATALQSYTETDPIYMADKPNIALKTEIPDVSGKADKTLIVTETEGNSSYSIAPNRLTKLGTLAAAVTLSLDTASEEAGVANVYDIVFTTPADAPSITWPEGVSWVGGSAPSIVGGKTYEVSIMDNLATYGEF